MCLGRHVAGGLLGAGTEEMLRHLLFQVLARFGVGQVEPVLVDQRLLMPSQACHACLETFS